MALQSPNLVSRARSRAFLTLIKIIFSISRLHNKCEFVFVYVYSLKIGVRYTYVNYFAKNERKFYGFFDKINKNNDLRFKHFFHEYHTHFDEEKLDDEEEVFFDEEGADKKGANQEGDDDDDGSEIEFWLCLINVIKIV